MQLHHVDSTIPEPTPLIHSFIIRALLSLFRHSLTAIHHFRLGDVILLQAGLL